MPEKPPTIGAVKTALALTIESMKGVSRPDPDRIRALEEGLRVISALAGLRARLAASPFVAELAQIIGECGWPGNPLEARHAPTEATPWTQETIRAALVKDFLDAMKERV